MQPQIPAPPAQTADQDPITYGCTVLVHVLAHGTSTCTTDQLRAADHAYPAAIHNPEILPIAVDRLTGARHQVLAALRARQTAQDAIDQRLREWLDQSETSSQTAGSEAQQGDQAPPMDPRDAAIRMMRAALQLIQGNETDPPSDQNGGGGSRVPIPPRPPSFTPPSAAADIPF